MDEKITTVRDVRQLLMTFGTTIYTGDALGDLELMAEELRELYHEWGMISLEQFQQAIGVLRREQKKGQGNT